MIYSVDQYRKRIDMNPLTQEAVRQRFTKTEREAYKLSIVTTVYNDAVGIRDTLNSVARANLAEVEHIVIDAGSSDGTRDVIEAASDHINILISEPDLGIYDGMNKGITVANGRFVGILNSGDQFHDGALTEILIAIDEFSDADVVHGGIILTDHKSIYHKVAAKSEMYYSDASQIPVHHAATFVAAKVYHELGLFDLSLKYCADRDFLHRVRKSGYKFVRIDRYFVSVLPGGVSMEKVLPVLSENRVVMSRYGAKPLQWLMYALNFIGCCLLEPVRRLQSSRIKRLRKIYRSWYRWGRS